MNVTAKRCMILKRPNGSYVGSPVDTSTVNPNLAACWTDEVEAKRHAEELGATIVDFDESDAAWRAAGSPRD